MRITKGLEMKLFLCTMPRSGTHWIKNILCEVLYLTPNNAMYQLPFFKGSNEEFIDLCYKPCLHYGHFQHSVRGVIVNQFLNKKMILLHRHPFDALISLFNFQIYRNIISKKKTAIAYLKDYIRGIIPEEINQTTFFLYNWTDRGRAYYIEEYFEDFVLSWLDKDYVVPINYEALVKDPRGQFDTLFAKLNITFDSNILDRAIANNTFKNLSGGRDIGVVENNSHYRSGTSKQWLNVLGEEDLNILYKKLYKTLSKLGYK